MTKVTAVRARFCADDRHVYAFDNWFVSRLPRANRYARTLVRAAKRAGSCLEPLPSVVSMGELAERAECSSTVCRHELHRMCMNAAGSRDEDAVFDAALAGFGGPPVELEGMLFDARIGVHACGLARSVNHRGPFDVASTSVDDVPIIVLRGRLWLVAAALIIPKPAIEA